MDTIWIFQVRFLYIAVFFDLVTDVLGLNNTP